MFVIIWMITSKDSNNTNNIIDENPTLLGTTGIEFNGFGPVSILRTDNYHHTINLNNYYNTTPVIVVALVKRP